MVIDWADSKQAEFEPYKIWFQVTNIDITLYKLFNKKSIKLFN